MKFTTLKPSYFDDFRCSGGDCKNTCCQGWSITMNKKDYLNAMRAKKSPELQELLEKTYKRDKKSLSASTYAKFNFDENYFCAMMSEDGFCKLQLECGYSALCQTCKIYPRERSHIAGDTMERDLSTTCEEVVKLLINQKNGIEFINCVEEVAVSDQVHFFVSPKTSNPIYKYYWDLKTMGIAILQSQEYSLEDRILILGIAIQHVIKLQQEDKLAEIPSYADYMMGIVATNELSELLSGFTFVENIGVNESLIFFLREFMSFEKSAIKKAFFDRVLAGLGGKLVEEEDDKTKKFFSIDNNLCRAKTVQFDEFISETPRVMENIMVNFFHLKALPLSTESNDIWELYVHFALSYSVFKNAAIGYFQEKPNMDDFIYSVVSVSRGLLHNEDLKKNLVAEYVKNDSSSLAHMAMIIKG